MSEFDVRVMVEVARRGETWRALEWSSSEEVVLAENVRQAAVEALRQAVGDAAAELLDREGAR